MASRKESKKYKNKQGLVDHLRTVGVRDAYHHVCHEYFKSEL